MGNELTVFKDQDFWNEKQLAALQQMGVSGASNADLAVFLHECQRTGLDPFLHQIYMINRKGKQNIQVGIDGLRLVARRAVDRTGETLSIKEEAWCGKDGKWKEFWAEDEPPLAAKVVLQRGKGMFPAIALYKEYAACKANGQLTGMWKQRPAGQLMKCAEALAIRMAFPQDLSGLHSDDEMDQADSPQDNDVVDAEVVDDSREGAATKAQRQAISDLLTQVGVKSPDMAASVLSRMTQRNVKGTADLLYYEAETFLSSRDLFVQRARQTLTQDTQPASPESKPATKKEDGDDAR